MSAVRGPQSLPLLAESVRQPLSPRALWAFPVGVAAASGPTLERKPVHRESGNKSNGSPQTLFVFLFLEEVFGDPLPVLPGWASSPVSSRNAPRRALAPRKRGGSAAARVGAKHGPLQPLVRHRALIRDQPLSTCRRRGGSANVSFGRAQEEQSPRCESRSAQRTALKLRRTGEGVVMPYSTCAVSFKRLLGRAPGHPRGRTGGA